MFSALCRRRNVRIRYERYAHALTASAVYNTSAGKHVANPMDWIREGAAAKRYDERMKIKEFISGVISRMPPQTTFEQLLEVKRKALIDIVNTGVVDHEEAERMFDAIWPTLKAKEEQ